MAVGPLRGGLPLIKLLLEKPLAEGEQPGKVLEKGVDGVLKPGQNMVLPAKTGLAHFGDHFDARTRPDYDKLLKGETRAEAKAPGEGAKAAKGAGEADRPPEARGAADSQASTAFATDSAMAVMDLLPQIAIPPPVPLAPAPELRQLRDVEEPEESDQPRDHHPHHEESGQGEGEDEEGELWLSFSEPLDPEVELGTVELQGGLFTLDDGSLDAREKRLCTLEAFVDGDVPYVSCAVDLAEVPYGARLRIPAIEAALGGEVRFRAVHQTERTEGTGTGRLEVCVSVPTPELRKLLERVLQVEVL